RFPNSYAHRTYSDQTFPRISVFTSAYLPAASLMFRSPTLRHKTAPRICLDETFPLLFLSLLLHLLPTTPFLGDVLTLPVRLRPPEMGIVVIIGAVCWYWEGVFVSGG
ncbi:MAG: hypothetical protein ACLR7M_07830, partial [Varibaculum timonense]